MIPGMTLVECAKKNVIFCEKIDRFSTGSSV